MSSYVVKLVPTWLSQRSLLKSLVARNLKVRFGGVQNRSWFGILLSQINPAVIIAVYAVVSGGILKVEAESFILFLAVGHIQWTLFTGVLSNSCNSVKRDSGLIKIVSFPLGLLVLADLLDLALETAITVGLLLFLAPVLGGGYWWGLVLYPLVFLLQMVFMSGLAAAFSALTAFFHDLMRLQALAIRLMFWFTPVIYTPAMIPEAYRGYFVYLNPMTLFLEVYRKLLCYQSLPEPFEWALLIGWTLAAFVGGWTIFGRAERFLPEEFT